MVDIILNNIYLILLLPLWIFLIIMLGRFCSVYVNKLIINALTILISLLGAVFCALGLYSLPQGSIIENQSIFIKVDDFVLSYGIYIDKTSLIFALVLFLVSFFVQLFSTSYMKKERKSYRFYALLNLFTFSMCGLFFSPNLYQTYVFWELAGIVSYLLIGFEYSDERKSSASKKVLITNRIGDCAFLGGIILSSYFMYSYGANPDFTSLSFVDMNSISTLIYAYTPTSLFVFICSLFIVAGVVKSAQLPFYTWLQDAMEAKLPVSALLHSATLVALGVFLLLRVMPFLTLETYLLKSVAIIGLLTALICSISACAQVIPKKVLAYSTSAQMGLVFFAIGVLNLKAAMIFFVAHAFIKPMLFLALPNENGKWTYFDFISFLIAGLSLSGIIFSGLVSKEMIFANCNSTLCIAGFLIITFLTAFYIVRIALFMTKDTEMAKFKKCFAQNISLIGFLVLNIIFYIFMRKQVNYEITEPFWIGVFAWVFAFILFKKDSFKKVPILYPLSWNGFYLDKFYTNCLAKLYGKFSNCLNSFDNKVLGNYNLVICGSKKAVKLVSLIEKYIMNGSVELIKKASIEFSRVNIRLQNGNIQKYNAYALVIITIILTCFVLATNSFK